VLSSAYSAEYGRATGGVVNTVTRSGTNSLLGTAFWFFRNRTLDAGDEALRRKCRLCLVSCHRQRQGSGGFSGNNAPGTLFDGNYSANRGPASFDVRERLVINWLYSPVFTSSTGAFAKSVVNNWQLANITTIQTGTPVTESLAVRTPLLTRASRTGVIRRMASISRQHPV